MIGESRSLSETELSQLNQTRADLFSILNQEEIYWKQRSSITWLKEGDSNTKFVHQIVNGRRNKNNIYHIRHLGQWAEWDKEIGKIFIDHFQNLLGTPIPNIFLLDWQNLEASRSFNA